MGLVMCVWCFVHSVTVTALLTKAVGQIACDSTSGFCHLWCLVTIAHLLLPLCTLSDILLKAKWASDFYTGNIMGYAVVIVSFKWKTAMLEPSVAIGIVLDLLHLIAGRLSEYETDIACVLGWARLKRCCRACEADQSDSL